jgi:NodT family efflux transporter outer membrane factor (OMF) lipoprotein
VRKIILVSVSCTALFLSACAIFPREELEEPAIRQLNQIEPQSRQENLEIADGWWGALGDEQLNRLIDQGLKTSPTIEQASLRVNAAKQGVDAELAGLMPNISAVGQVNQQRLSQNYIYMPGMPVTTSYGMVGGSLNWSLDIWGKQKKRLDAAKQGVLASKADYAFTKLWFSSTIALSYFDYDQAVKFSDFSERELTLRENLFKIAEQRYAKGLVDHAVFDQRKIDWEMAQVSSNQAKLSVLIIQHQLATLVGQGPSFGEALYKPKMTGQMPNLPENIPADLLARRPDLQALLAQIKAARLSVTVAKMSYLPDINLQGLIGLQSFGLGQLFNGKSRQYSLGPGMNLPIFDGGAIDANIGAKEVQRNQVIANYHAGLLEALKESADAIARVKYSGMDLSLIAKTHESAKNILTTALEKKRVGIYSDEQSFIAEVNFLQVSRQWVNAQTKQSVATINLIQALGGSYITESPQVAPQ